MRAICLLLAALAPGLAAAQGFAPPTAAVSRWEAGVLGGYRWEGEIPGFDNQFTGRALDIALADGPVLGLAVAAPLGGVHQIELWVTHREAEMEPSLHASSPLGDLEMTYVHLSALRHWYTRLDVATYVGLGGGVTMFGSDAVDTGDETHPSVSLFMGAKKFLGSRLALRADVRGYWTIGDDELSNRIDDVRFGYPDDLIQVEATVGVAAVF